MIADVISQLERREGMLPLSVEDRPQLSALNVAQPERLGAIREAHALASRHFPSESELRLRLVRYTDTPGDGDHLVAEVWVDTSLQDAMQRLRAFDLDWEARIPSPPSAFLVTLSFRRSVR